MKEDRECLVWKEGDENRRMHFFLQTLTQCYGVYLFFRKKRHRNKTLVQNQGQNIGRKIILGELGHRQEIFYKYIQISRFGAN